MYIHLTHVYSSNGDGVAYLNKITVLSRIVEGAQWMPLIGPVVQSV